MNKIWAIRHTITKTFLRNRTGSIMFFMSHEEAQSYINENLPQDLWDAEEYKR